MSTCNNGLTLVRPDRAAQHPAANLIFSCYSLPLACLHLEVSSATSQISFMSIRRSDDPILHSPASLLSDGRYTWRYDSILLELKRQLKESMAQAKDDTGAEVYADLDQLRASENPPGTIPCQLVVTTARPDLVVIKGNVIRILELTVCTNSREAMSNARTRKLSKISYQQLLGELERQGKDVRYITLEMGALGHYPGDLVALMSGVFPEIRKNAETSSTNCPRSQSTAPR